MPTIFPAACRQRLVVSICLAAFLLGAFGGVAAAAQCPCDDSSNVCVGPTKVCLPRTQDEVWLISSRCLGCPDNEPLPPRFQVYRYNLSRHEWGNSSLDAFLAAQKPTMPTDFWIHGDRTDAQQAREMGMEVYQQLTACVSGDQPIRFVIYSWRADPIRGLRRDAREKAARTNSEGYYLACLVNAIDHQVSVNFIGYSFGARITTGALHLLGGGTLCGRSLPEPIASRAPMQAVLVAAAVNNDWLAMDRCHNQALPVVDRMLALNNGCDRALKHYPAIDPCTRPQALGYTGAVGPLGDNGRKLRQIDMCCVVGKQHYWGNYFYNPGIVALVRPYVGLAD